MFRLFFILVSLSASAGVERFCFSSPHEAARANKILDSIKVPSDRIVVEDNCLIATVGDHRVELIQKYLMHRFPNVQFSFSEKSSSLPPCQIKIEEVGMGKNNYAGGEIRNGQVIVDQSDLNKRQTTVSTINVDEGKSFEFQVDQDKVRGNCKRRGKTVEIDLELIDVVPTYSYDQPLPDKKDQTALKTTVSLSPGSKIEVGGTVRNLKNNGHKVEIPTGASANTMSDQGQTQVYLSVD